ncbi:HlyD family efflux transporter periplasmic adaptor subunit [Subsaxibacter sp. CAU 1640]|uniref:efflux RND transporter periplasmic adaptor subunit n=1 Tax=Subsaxibacter sp. CAU 1640 TaxID=2933271 RepID=UPI002006BFC9|nr:HlyD family efflux transporter periplasmic adaptor subunit [Subsaxibacter sp. CAU 1640]MCK7591350.1 HlyD family efflux transporter periplasmic adaptor subunit [Subsaxibacter sp. CAU 1640]
MKNQYFKYIITLLIVISFSACKKKTDTVSEKKAPISVTTVAVQQNDMKEYLTFNGVTQYQKKENIRSNVTGYISWMKFKIGDNIRSGQTFASVRTKEQDALKEAVKIDSSLSKFVSPITIRSNATGVFTVLNVTANDYVAEGDVLATVVQPKSLVIQVNVPYEYEDAIQIGTSCEIILQNGEVLNTQVTGTLPTIDPVAQSQVFLIALPDANLPENLNVQVRTIYKQDTSAMTIPKTALQTNELLSEFWVMKVVNDSLAIKQTVMPSLKNDSLVQVKSDGLKINDLVISEGAYQMQDSTIVSTKKQ